MSNFTTATSLIAGSAMALVGMFAEPASAQNMNYVGSIAGPNNCTFEVHTGTMDGTRGALKLMESRDDSDCCGRDRYSTSDQSHYGNQAISQLGLSGIRAIWGIEDASRNACHVPDGGGHEGGSHDSEGGGALGNGQSGGGTTTLGAISPADVVPYQDVDGRVQLAVIERTGLTLG